MIPFIFWINTSIENAPAEIHKDEDQPWKGFTVFLHVLLPIAGLAFLWGQRGIFSKLLHQLDRNCVAVYCPSLSKREKLLKWASDRLPTTWSSQARTLSSGIPELWKDGSLLCTLINSVVPGACPNPHRHWRKPPLHAQALACKYLGLIPMFTEDDFSTEFTIHQEKKFIQYLQKLQEAVNKWPTDCELNPKFSFQYVARGMGLCTGEQYRKTIFYVYSNATGKRRSNVLMYIRGPYGTKGTATISPFHNLRTIPVVNVLQNQLEATKILPFKNEEQKSFLKTISLDFTSLISDVEEKEEKNDIPIQIDMEIDRAKITYIPNDYGIYEINLICDGELLRGSPFSVQINKNSSEKKDSFNTEYENVKEKITFTKRKILSKVIDCIDEKICIDSNKTSKTKMKNTLESSTDSENNDLTITAVTKRKDEILKTEINCTLEDIIEEINLVQTTEDHVSKEINDEKTIDQHDVNTLEQIKKIAEQLKTEIPDIVQANQKGYDDTDGVQLQIDTQHKVVKNFDEAKTEIINLLQTDFDEVDNVKNHTPKEPLVSKVDIELTKSTKYIKNIVNLTNKEDMFEKMLPVKLKEKSESDEDENNNFSKNAPLKRIKSKISLEVKPKIVSKPSMSVNFPNVTSPICPDHIAPEVEKSSLNQLTLSEKRKVFSKQNSVGKSDGDIAFSNSENDDSSKSKDSTFKELSVLNILNSLKQIRKTSLSESSDNSITSAASLPNITSTDSNCENIYESTFRERKDYWERVSSRSSSNFSLESSDYSKKTKPTTSKNLFIKKDMKKPLNNENVTEVIPSLRINHQLQKSDTSLEDCCLVPLEERKKQLLKKMYNSEMRTPKNLNKKPIIFKRNVKSESPEEETQLSTIQDNIKKFNNTSKENNKNNGPSKEEDSNDMKKPSNKEKIKSHFKRAFRFFKNIEDASKSKEKNNIKRRYSLDFQKKGHKKFQSGSLNLPHISDRFSVNNLYEDVFGSRRGSFKGTPNKSEVANSLASVSQNLERKNHQIPDENNISYNMFVNKAKSKKRKSIRSIFDVNY